MSQTADILLTKVLEIEKEFEAFSSFCKKQNFTKSEMDIIYAPIKKELKIKFWIKFFKIFAVLTFLSSSVYYIPFINWNISAIGRIAMIKILPIWNWKVHFNDKCLMPYFDVGLRSYKTESKFENVYRDDCAVCETLGKKNGFGGKSILNFISNFQSTSIPSLK